MRVTKYFAWLFLTANSIHEKGRRAGVTLSRAGEEPIYENNRRIRPVSGAGKRRGKQRGGNVRDKNLGCECSDLFGRDVQGFDVGLKDNEIVTSQ